MSYIEGDLFTGAPDEPVDPIAGAAEPVAPAARAAGETLTREEARAWEADLRSLGAELQLEDDADAADRPPDDIPLFDPARRLPPPDDYTFAACAHCGEWSWRRGVLAEAACCGKPVWRRYADRTCAGCGGALSGACGGRECAEGVLWARCGVDLGGVGGREAE